MTTSTRLHKHAASHPSARTVTALIPVFTLFFLYFSTSPSLSDVRFMELLERSPTAKSVYDVTGAPPSTNPAVRTRVRG
ncbi:hypothetical protein HDV57DRAFT_91581 [Trichoderma longibrachiatum]|uniref:Uncharacterized protein n=1 Tax=Trichoderma longibrachiatum ATCC 18648 TaxID=983965 RepID=A0A2T4BT52_TRILO|nr:hypothetical protein M440DRAFT_158484 [Trichoderma longibrachiatum ATCC 18648]